MENLFAIVEAVENSTLAASILLLLGVDRSCQPASQLRWHEPVLEAAAKYAAVHLLLQAESALLCPVGGAKLSCKAFWGETGVKKTCQVPRCPGIAIPPVKAPGKQNLAKDFLRRSFSSQVGKPALQCCHHRLRAVRCLQAHQDHADVTFHRCHGDSEFLSDLPICPTLHQQREHLTFAQGQV